MDYLEKEEVLKDNKMTQYRSKYREGICVTLFKETGWESKFQNLSVEQWYNRYGKGVETCAPAVGEREREWLTEGLKKKKSQGTQRYTRKGK